MRVMIISHTYVEPINRNKWVILHKLVPELETIVITPSSWVDPEFGGKNSVQDSMAQLHFVPINICGSGYGSRYFFIDPSIYSLIHHFKPDIIQVEAEPWSLVYIQMVVCRRLFASKARMVCFSWWNSLEWKTPLHFPGSLTFKIGCHATDLMITGSHFGVDLYRHYGYLGSIDIIPQLGVDTEKYRPSLPDSELVKHYNLELNFVIGFVGRLHWRKGIETLLDAVAGLEVSSWKLLLVGDGPQRDKLVARAKLLGISERMIITGAIPHQQMPRYMSIMNLLVLPSTKEQWEQFGHVLIEAMACGVPVIGSTSGEIPYVIRDAGLVFPIGDVYTLREQITQLATQPEMAKRIRLSALRRVKEEYDDEAIARRLHAAYTKICPTTIQ